ncbi:Galactosylceramide sulfotransferase [Holothuria leucospilota]|uniref:Galactosylceramide sulfotransferase n=1 Tax=Holothuria leucospilota TaxID=206669 RepID=A0A9Q1H3B6_HOLLE|nr:Galactosylceramide sulfotransferase [Holothuria leucospilota]
MRMKARYLVLLLGCCLLLCLVMMLSGRDADGRKPDKASSRGLGDLEFNQNGRKNSKSDTLDGKKTTPGEGHKVLNEPHNHVLEVGADRPRQLEKVVSGGSARERKDNAKEKQHPLPRGKLSEIGSFNSKVRQDCIPRENVTFIKAHKTGSSTVQNIFLRYGEKHNLTFVLPPAGHHLGYPNYFEKRYMLRNERDVYNIFCHHARFSQTIPQVMPPNTLYITIVRDPVKVFESAFIYFKMDYRLGMTNDPKALEKFLKNAESYYQSATNKVHMKNPMLFDLGFSMEDFHSEALIQKAIKTFHKRFRLVMVAEYFEESLILLRDLLCWSTEDVVVFKMNTRKDDSIVPLTEQTKEGIRSWNKGDVMLYEHFNRTIQDRIGEYGRARMAEQVALLRQKTQELYDKCIESDKANKEDGDFKVWQPFGVHINAFVLRTEEKENPLCARMIIPEIQYTKNLRKKQYGIESKPQNPQAHQNDVFKYLGKRKNANFPQA